MRKKEFRTVGSGKSEGLSLKPVLWLPSLLLLFLPAYEIIRSLSVHNYVSYLFWVHDEVLNGLAVFCFVTAGVAALIPPFRHLVARHLDRLSDAPRWVHLAWVGAAYFGFLAWFGFVRFCQYRGFLLPQDTAITVNDAYNFIHHGSLYLSIFGVHQLSIHFFLLMQVFSPILLVWKSPLALLFLQNVFVCSLPFAAYAMTYLLTSSSMAGFCGMWLTLSSPSIYELLTSNLHNPSLAAFFPWAMFFLYLQRWWISGFLFLLMIPCVEQVPFIFFGLGLYTYLSKKPWRWAGIGLCIGAVLLWVGEILVISHYQKLEGPDVAGSTYWLLFKYLVPDGTPYSRIFPEIISHPFRSLFYTFSSVYRFFPITRVLFSTGFLGILNPVSMIPFFTSILPQVLAAPPDPVKFLDYHPITYFDFGLHHPSYMFGPLIFGTAWGIRRSYVWLKSKNWESWLLVWVFVFSGVGFLHAHRTIMPAWRMPWFDAMPRVISQIPSGARVWVDEYASPQVSLRRWVKITQWGPGAPMGYHKLFKPDYVLIDKAFVVMAKPPYRDQMLTFWALNGYRKIADDNNVLLLKSPSLSLDPESDIFEWIQLPTPDSKYVSSFSAYLLNGPLSPI